MLRLLPLVIGSLLGAALIGLFAVGVLITLAILIPVGLIALWLMARFRPDLVRRPQRTETTVIETTYTVDRVDDERKR